MGVDAQRFGDWWVQRKLGKGGQGEVWLVRKISQDELFRLNSDFRESLASVQAYGRRKSTMAILLQAFELMSDRTRVGALKRLHDPADAKNPRSQKRRFERELRALGSVSHPSLVKVLDSNEEQEWFVMEYHRDGRLTDRLDRYKGQPIRAIDALLPVAEAVAELHRKGFIHRDIKPDNILIADDGRLVLGDLGIAHETDSDATRVTETNENVLSREWGPTWAHGSRLDNVPKSFDTFTLGKVLWSMISGHHHLRLHHYDDDEFNLAKMFADEGWPALVNEFFAKCITDRRNAELADGDAFAAGLRALRAHIAAVVPGASSTDVPTTADPSALAVQIVTNAAASHDQMVTFRDTGTELEIEIGGESFGVYKGLDRARAKEALRYAVLKWWLSWVDDHTLKVTNTGDSLARETLIW